MTVVVGDFGATNIRLAFIRKGQMSDIYRFVCDDFQNAYQLLRMFVSCFVPDASAFILGVPGPVVNGRVIWTNRNWKLEAEKLKKLFKLDAVFLKNDLEIQGESLLCLSQKDMVFLQKGKVLNETKVLLNVGTGLGACVIRGTEVYPAEYGQTLFEDGLPLEAIVSATGFQNLHTAIKTDSQCVLYDSFISCRENNSKTKEVDELFCLYLARALMNFALICNAQGGVYFSGNILDEKLLKVFKIAQKFQMHPKMSYMLKKMPLIFVKRKDFVFDGFKKLVKKYGLS